MLHPIYEFRPLEAGEYLRYNGGNWKADDGEHDIAFVDLRQPFAYGVHLPYRPNILWSWCKNLHWRAIVPNHPRGNAWHYMLREGESEWGDSWGRDNHPNEIAHRHGMDKCCKRAGCANGRGPEFHIADPYIAAGLLRRADTKEVVVFPEIFDCMYCGPVDYKAVDSRFKNQTVTA